MITEYGSHGKSFDHARQVYGFPNDLDIHKFESLLDPFKVAVNRYSSHPAFSCLSHTISFRELDDLSDAFASYLIHYTELKKGDRIAIQLPNVLQYPVAIYGALKAGLIIVNTNPLYTSHEMQHQFNDAGVKAIVILANMASKLESILSDTPIQKIIVTEMADFHPWPQRLILNAAVKHIKKLIPDYHLKNVVKLREALKLGRASMAMKPLPQYKTDPDDIAVLQYTGGTTGVAKAAMLSHRNLLANMHQVEPILDLANLKYGVDKLIAPLPIYHIYAFMLHVVTAPAKGCHSILIPNPRDISSFISVMKKHEFQIFVGLNTLFIALMHNKDFSRINFGKLKITLSGGMALSESVAKEWHAKTGCMILEGYGLTETSPVVSINPPSSPKPGTIGLPLPLTYLKTVDSSGFESKPGEAGELCVKGPQVMQGYWNRPEETASVLQSGWLHTGDIAVIGSDGFVRIVDRKKDMILVSGFNVYPNEVEAVVNSHPDVLESAAIGVPDAYSGEAVKLYVVPRKQGLSEEDIKSWCHEYLTAYKCPKYLEFRTELPKSNVGKILRRELR